MRTPTSLAQLDSDEAALEAANNAYRSTHDGLNLADYQKYKDNIAGWRQTLGGQDEIIVTARPRTSQASINGQVGQITATLVGKQVEAFAEAAIETGASPKDVKYIRGLGKALPLLGSAITFKDLRQKGFSVQAALAGTAANEVTGDRII